MAMNPSEETFVHKGKRWRRIPAEPFQRFCMGVDLGQAADYTAIAVLDHTVTPDWNANEATGEIRQRHAHLESWHL
jgi:hypothetical protein